MDDDARNVLAPLQVDRTASCYRLGPGSSERMAVMAPGHALRAIDHVEINRFVERQGVTYYVLEVFLKSHRKKAAHTSHTSHIAPHVVRFPSADAAQDDESDEVLIDVELDATPSLELERRYSDFEALRHKLSVSIENLHPGGCLYCDAFVDFLSSSTTQPGLFTKLTTRPPQRKSVLSNFMNKTIQLALPPPGECEDAACDGWSILPQIVEGFLRDPPSQS